MDGLFPVMGPAIRKSIANTLAEMLESLNQTLAVGFSGRAEVESRGMEDGEALRAGRPAPHAPLPRRAGLPDPPGDRPLLGHVSAVAPASRTPPWSREC